MFQTKEVAYHDRTAFVTKTEGRVPKEIPFGKHIPPLPLLPSHRPFHPGHPFSSHPKTSPPPWVYRSPSVTETREKDWTLAGRTVFLLGDRTVFPLGESSTYLDVIA